jgi:ankyrin repeat protein
VSNSYVSQVRDLTRASVIAVHGLYGSNESWVPAAKAGATEPPKSWLSTRLFARLWARVMMYGYSSHSGYGGSGKGSVWTRKGITDYAIALLESLAEARKGQTKFTPIVFVAHDIGGTIVKEALNFASRNRSTFGDILDSTMCLMFFGVPHRSPSFSNLQDELARLIVTADPDSEPVPHDRVLSMASAVYAVNDAFPQTKVLLWAYITNMYSNDSSTSVRLFEPFTVTTETPQEWRYPHDGSHMRLPLAGEEQGFYENTFELCLRRASTEIRLSESTNDELETLYNRAAPIFPPGEYKSQDSTLRWIIEHEKTKAFLQDYGANVLHVQGRVNVAEAADRLYRHIDSELVRLGMKPYLTRFEFSRLDTRRSTIGDMAASFMSQIVLHQYQMDASTIGEFDPVEGLDSGTFMDLWDAFDTVRNAVGKNWWGIFVVDGLDQCDEAGAMFFLDELKRIMATSEQYFKVIITTTTGSAPELTEELNLYPTIDLDDESREYFSFETANDSYYDRHLGEAIASQKHIPFCDSTIRDLLGTCSYDLRAGLQLIHWLRWSKATTTLTDMVGCLEMLHSISDVDVLFRTIVDTIPAPRRLWAKLVVKWALYSFQPLRSQQLAVALAFAARDEDPATESVDFDDKELISDLRSCFGSLIHMNYDEVRVGHPSAVNFLHQWVDGEHEPGSPSQIHKEIAELCIRYLELPKYRERIERAGTAIADVLTTRGGTNIGDFFTYAVQWLPAHFGYAIGFTPAESDEKCAPNSKISPAMPTLPPFLVDFYSKVLRKQPHFFTKLGVAKVIRRTAPVDHPFLKALFSAESQAVAHGSVEQNEALDATATEIDQKKEDNATTRNGASVEKSVAHLSNPLVEAPEGANGPETWPSNSIEKPETQASAQDSKVSSDAPEQPEEEPGILQLDIAALYGQHGLVEDALKRAEPSAAEIMSALRLAVMTDDQKITARLIDVYVATEKEKPTWSPFVTSRLAWSGYTGELAKTLKDGAVSTGVYAFSGDDDPEPFTALSYAVVRNHMDTVKLLLQSEPAPTPEFVRGSTCLRWAVKMGYPEMVRLLLKWLKDHPTQKNEPVAADTEKVEIPTEASADAAKVEKKTDGTNAPEKKVEGAEEVANGIDAKPFQDRVGEDKPETDVAPKIITSEEQAEKTDGAQQPVVEITGAQENGADEEEEEQEEANNDEDDDKKVEEKPEDANKGEGEVTPEDANKDEGEEKAEEEEKPKKVVPETLVSLATLLGHHRVLSALLDAGEDPQIVGEASDGVEPPFIKAANNARLQTLEILLDHGVPVDGPKGIKTGTALSSAAFVGMLKVCQLLIKRGANVNPGDGCCPTVLHGVEGNDQEIVKLLLDNGADINAHRGKGTALLVAADRKRWDMAKLLIERGADVTAEQGNSPGCTALYYACTNRATEICKLLVEKDTEKVTINKSTGPRKWSNLHAAYDVPEIIDLLVANGADVESPSEDGTVMYLATWYNCPDSIVALQKHKANMEKPFVQDGYADNHFTPLRAAISKSLEQVSRTLIEGGADINTKRETDQTTPLHDAMNRRDADMMALLLDYTPNLESKEENGRSPLNCIDENTPVSLVKALVNRGADIESRATSGVTPLATAVSAPNMEVVTYLLSKKADLAIGVPRWGSPLHIACRRLDLPMVDLLLKSGADVNFPDSEFPGTPMMSTIFFPEDKTDEEVLTILKRLAEDERADFTTVVGFYGTALLTAVLTRGVDVVKFVLEHKGDVSVSDATGRHPLHHAGFRSVEHIELLMEQKGADINVKDLLGRSPLHTAVNSGRKDIVEKVLGLIGEDKINDPDRDGWTPLMWAARVLTQWGSNPSGQSEIIKLLLSKKADLYVTGEGLGRDWTPAEVARFSGASDEVVKLLAPKLKRGSIAGRERWSWKGASNMRRGKLWEDGFCDSCLLVSAASSSMTNTPETRADITT